MKRHLICLLLVMSSAVLLPADVIYAVSVNTNAYQGQSGYLDFQLGRGPDSQSVSASVSDFAADGSFNATGTQVAGGVTGSLPGMVSITNSTQFNDYFRSFTYGSTISFQLTFSGPAINSPNGTSTNGSPFYFGLYDAGQLPLGPTDGFDNALLIQVNTNGSTTPQVYNSAVSVVNASTIPEPSTYGLMFTALGTLGWRLRKRVS